MIVPLDAQINFTFRLKDSLGLRVGSLIQPCRDAPHHIPVKRSIETVGDISDVGGSQHIFHASKRMLRRQWFEIEHINRGSRYCMRAKCLDEGWLVNDRAT